MSACGTSRHLAALRIWSLPGAQRTSIKRRRRLAASGDERSLSEVILNGQTAQLSIAEPGTYDYNCGLHPAMKGKIEVKKNCAR